MPQFDMIKVNFFEPVSETGSHNERDQNLSMFTDSGGSYNAA